MMRQAKPVNRACTAGTHPHTTCRPPTSSTLLINNIKNFEYISRVQPDLRLVHLKKNRVDDGRLECKLDLSYAPDSAVKQAFVKPESLGDLPSNQIFCSQISLRVDNNFAVCIHLRLWLPAWKKCPVNSLGRPQRMRKK